MAYVRFSGPGGPWAYESDIYIYDCEVESVGPVVECCCCNLLHATHPTGCFRSTTRAQMIEHVQAHVEFGDRVPDHVIPALRHGHGGSAIECSEACPGHPVHLAKVGPYPTVEMGQ